MAPVTPGDYPLRHTPLSSPSNPQRHSVVALSRSGRSKVMAAILQPTIGFVRLVSYCKYNSLQICGAVPLGGERTAGRAAGVLEETIQAGYGVQSSEGPQGRSSVNRILSAETVFRIGNSRESEESTLRPVSQQKWRLYTVVR